MSTGGPQLSTEEKTLFVEIMRTGDKDLRATKLNSLPLEQKQKCMQWVKFVQLDQARRQKIAELEAKAATIQQEVSELQSKRSSVITQYGLQAAGQLSDVVASSSSSVSQQSTVGFKRK